MRKKKKKTGSCKLVWICVKDPDEAGDIELLNSLYIYNFISLFRLPWDFVTVHELSLVLGSGCYSVCKVRASLCGGFLLWGRGSRCTGFNSCSTWV